MAGGRKLPPSIERLWLLPAACGAHCLLLAVCYPSAAHGLLPTVYCPLSATHYLLPTICYSLSATHCLLLAVYYCVNFEINVRPRMGLKPELER
jgi:hypothetical protein